MDDDGTNAAMAASLVELLQQLRELQFLRSELQWSLPLREVAVQPDAATVQRIVGALLDRIAVPELLGDVVESQVIYNAIGLTVDTDSGLPHAPCHLLRDLPGDLRGRSGCQRCGDGPRYGLGRQGWLFATGIAGLPARHWR